jgi:hypothetical protein
MGYSCDKCKLAVIVITVDEKTEVIKACQCDAPITAQISAKVYGVGGVVSKNNQRAV